MYCTTVDADRPELAAERYQRNYRDVMLNLVMKGDAGTPFVCEVQVTLSGISILKKYTRRFSRAVHQFPFLFADVLFLSERYALSVIPPLLLASTVLGDAASTRKTSC